MAMVRSKGIMNGKGKAQEEGGHFSDGCIGAKCRWSEQQGDLTNCIQAGSPGWDDKQFSGEGMASDFSKTKPVTPPRAGANASARHKERQMSEPGIPMDSQTTADILVRESTQLLQPPNFGRRSRGGQRGNENEGKAWLILLAMFLDG
ncbi:hypothetical protein ASPTUDRAFT_61403 [Aspergillus tubingensis CBS 134.48]|uniref:Uncharacterized protein n=1 Tax=Aspergillus tubingensis (strain CBS 134.48) TaxID=767770 RepID=A0A1L9NFJ4_ASPTC|nr:hypothetical protein ASPTUDRAFT_61403 [Aspergillus tubingensis CBS 134.48]